MTVQEGSTQSGIPLEPRSGLDNFRLSESRLEYPYAQYAEREQDRDPGKHPFLLPGETEEHG